MPDAGSAALESASGQVSYGLGMIPVTARIYDTTWITSLWSRDGGYVVPLEGAVRRVQQVDVGDTVASSLNIDV